MNIAMAGRVRKPCLEAGIAAMLMLTGRGESRAGVACVVGLYQARYATRQGALASDCG